jgi:hypothetical protein
MQYLQRDDIWNLQDYEGQREIFRRCVMQHKCQRQVSMHDQVRLLFEDRLTVQYQIQEMLRIEKISADGEILQELATYNPLIPDGHNLKATMLLEYPDETKRRRRLAELINVEQYIWLQVKGYERVFAICNEDLERSNNDKTSSVHFLRFELSAAMIADIQAEADIQVGIKHPAISAEGVIVPVDVRHSFRRDLH